MKYFFNFQIRRYIIQADTQVICKKWVDAINEQIKLKSAIMEGFLIKKGGTIKNWKRRYFRLTPISLEYYVDKNVRKEESLDFF